MSIIVHSYKEGCEACIKLKRLLISHDIPFTSVYYEKLQHPFKSLPQVFNPGGTYVGDYNTIRQELEPKGDVEY